MEFSLKNLAGTWADDDDVGPPLHPLANRLLAPRRVCPALSCAGGWVLYAADCVQVESWTLCAVIRKFVDRSLAIC